MAIEFMPWYTAGTQLLVCDSCGVVVRDTDLHLSWHRKIENGNGTVVEDELDRESPLRRVSKGW